MRAQIAPYLPLLAVILAGLLGQVRSYAAETGFWHDRAGHILLSLGGALLGAALTIAARGELTKAAVLMALTGAATAFFSATKPIGKEAIISSTLSGQENTLRGNDQNGRIDLRLLLGLSCLSAGAIGLTLLLSGCAPGADGLRQACTNADHVITSGYQSAVAFDHANEEMIRSLAPVDAAQARTMFNAHKQVIEKVFLVLARAVVDKKKFCDQAWNEDARLDWGSLLVGVVQVAADVKQAIAALMPAPQSMRILRPRWLLRSPVGVLYAAGV